MKTTKKEGLIERAHERSTGYVAGKSKEKLALNPNHPFRKDGPIDTSLPVDNNVGNSLCKICNRKYTPDGSRSSELGIGPACFARMTVGDDSIQKIFAPEFAFHDFSEIPQDIKNMVGELALIARAENAENAPRVFGEEVDSIAVEAVRSFTVSGEELLKDQIKPNDFNPAVFNGSDTAVLPFVRAGVGKVNPGDVFVLHESSKNALEGVPSRSLVVEAFALEDAQQRFVQPFDSLIDTDVRAPYLLQVRHGETFEGLIEDACDKLVAKKLLTQEDYETLKNAMETAKKRLAATECEQFDDYSGQGETLISLLDSDGAKKMQQYYPYNNAVSTLSKRTLSLDDGLIAAKELLLVADGKEITPTTPASSFTLPFSHELREAGVIGVVYKFENDKLAEIKLARLDFNEAKDPVHGPLRAAMAMNLTYMDGLPNSNSKREAWIDDEAAKGISYHIAVDGCVNAPENKQHFESKHFFSDPSSIPTKMVRAGETYRLGNRQLLDGKENIVSVLELEQTGERTRLVRSYFYAHQPELLNPLVQGKLTTGTSADLYTSCLYDPDLSISKATQADHPWYYAHYMHRKTFDCIDVRDNEKNEGRPYLNYDAVAPICLSKNYRLSEAAIVARIKAIHDNEPFNYNSDRTIGASIQNDAQKFFHFTEHIPAREKLHGIMAGLYGRDVDGWASAMREMYKTGNPKLRKALKCVRTVASNPTSISRNLDLQEYFHSRHIDTETPVGTLPTRFVMHNCEKYYEEEEIGWINNQEYRTHAANSVGLNAKWTDMLNERVLAREPGSDWTVEEIQQAKDWFERAKKWPAIKLFDTPGYRSAATTDRYQHLPFHMSWMIDLKRDRTAVRDFFGFDSDLMKDIGLNGQPYSEPEDEE